MIFSCIYFFPSLKGLKRYNERVYQFLERETSDRTNIGRNQLLNYLSFSLYPFPLHLTLTVPLRRLPTKHLFRIDPLMSRVRGLMGGESYFREVEPYEADVYSARLHQR